MRWPNKTIPPPPDHLQLCQAITLTHASSFVCTACSSVPGNKNCRSSSKCNDAHGSLLFSQYGCNSAGNKSLLLSSAFREFQASEAEPCVDYFSLYMCGAILCWTGPTEVLRLCGATRMTTEVPWTGEHSSSEYVGEITQTMWMVHFSAA